MKKKVAFWVVMILANAIISVVSVRTYRNMEARLTTAETYQRNWDHYQAPYPLSSFNDRIAQLELAHQKTAAELSRILGIDGKYDFNNNLVGVWDLNKFFDYKAYVRISLLLEVSEELRKLNPSSVKSVTKVISEAPAVVIGRYVLMASHTSDAKILSRQTVMIRTPAGVLEGVFEFKVLEYNAALLMADGSEYSLKELYRNKEKDFNLFEMPASRAGGPENVKTPNFPFEIGKSNELRIGHFIYLNGRPKINSEVARPGVVTFLAIAVPYGALGLEVKKDNNEFSLSQSTDNGDSGSPIMAFRDGRPELVGIYLGWTEEKGDNGKNTRSRALKINVAVDEIKEKLGIDLRELQREILYN